MIISEIAKKSCPFLVKELNRKEEACNIKRVAIIFSGGPAPGVNAIVYAAMEALKECTFIGLRYGIEGLFTGDHVELSLKEVEKVRYAGGFDLLGTGRKKLRDLEDFQEVEETLNRLKVDLLVVIGGDDSNTSAAFFAEYLLAKKSPLRIIGVPKTIDGDLVVWPSLPISFGFDSAAHLYSHLISNLAKDLKATRRYWHFVRLMGRSASHLTLECALRTRPNLALLSEEIAKRKISLEEIVEDITSLILEREALGKNYGLILIPEGLVEAVGLDKIPERFKKELGKELFDSYGNLALSRVEAERFLIELVRSRLQERTPGFELHAMPHFYGYEGRGAEPTPFDRAYCDALGRSLAKAIKSGKTAHLVTVEGLTLPQSKWKDGAIALVSLLNEEQRAGKKMVVIRKHCVSLESAPFMRFAKERADWRRGDDYQEEKLEAPYKIPIIMENIS